MSTTEWPKLHQRGNAHWYELQDGRTLPSVTTMLTVVAKPALMYWAANVERESCIKAAADLWEGAPHSPPMSRASYVATLTQRLGKEKAHTKKLQAAGDIGSQVHALAEWNLRRELGEVQGPEPQISREAAVAFSKYETWRATVDLTPLKLEQTVWSDAHGYAGTLDLYARVGELACVGDWKTGKAIYPEARLQIAAYREALIELGHATRDTYGLIVRLPKAHEDPDPEAMLITPAECDELFKVFLHVKALWEWANP